LWPFAASNTCVLDSGMSSARLLQVQVERFECTDLLLPACGQQGGFGVIPCGNATVHQREFHSSLRTWEVEETLETLHRWRSPYCQSRERGSDRVSSTDCSLIRRASASTNCWRCGTSAVPADEDSQALSAFSRGFAAPTPALPRRVFATPGNTRSCNKPRTVSISV